jgi:putative MATE family efflux protein
MPTPTDSDTARPAAPDAASAHFVTGSILRHILVMTATGAVGLMAIFLGDLANMLFLSMLRDQDVIAAVGYAGSLQFLAISVGIGLSIAAAALVSPAIGAGDRVQARRLSASCHVFTAVTSTIIAMALWIAVPRLLSMLGASGRPHALATTYLRILLPALPLLAVAMTSSAVLRSVGDARRAMHVTLAGAAVNVALDPLLIFGLGLGIEGAALASAVSRFAALSLGLYGVARAHDLIVPPMAQHVMDDASAIVRIAVPAVLANVATPLGNAYVTAAIAPFGDSAVAGWAIVGRIIPVAFGAIYALSGSVGPVLGQNLGARADDRVRSVLTASLKVNVCFTLGAWFVLFLLARPLVAAFGADGKAADLIILFCRWLSPLFGFLGALFVANAAFNVLGRPHYSTLFNWGRATVGTVPFAEIGGRLAGSDGVIAGNMIGGIVFGILAVLACYGLLERRP